MMNNISILSFPIFNCFSTRTTAVNPDGTPAKVAPTQRIINDLTRMKTGLKDFPSEVRSISGVATTNVSCILLVTPFSPFSFVSINERIPSGSSQWITYNRTFEGYYSGPYTIGLLQFQNTPEGLIPIVSQNIISQILLSGCTAEMILLDNLSNLEYFSEICPNLPEKIFDGFIPGHFSSISSLEKLKI